MEDAPTTGTGPAQLADLGERYFAQQHSYDPLNATLLGLSEFDHLVGDPSREAGAAAADAFAGIADELATVDAAGLSEAEQVDHQVLTVLNRGAEGDARHALWAANASAKGYVSRQGLLFQAVPAMTLGSSDGCDRYLSRLGAAGTMLTSLGQRYLTEARDGRVPTARGVRHAIQQLEGYLALELEQDVLLKPTTGDPSDRVRSRALTLVDQAVRPAMAALAELLRAELLPVSRPDDRVGIGYVPGGEEGYQAALARHTTTDLTAEEVHQIGLDALAELAPRWSELGQRALQESDFPTLAGRMRADRSLRFENRQQIVDVAQAALERAQVVQDSWFPRYDIPDCVIEEINPLEAAHAALAYYRPPAVDGSRPGAHCLLTTEPEQRFRFEYECLVFHESVPGHHLQLATAQLLDIPRYRRYLDVEACSFNEGWGLYSEQLADEIGLYSSDVDRLGMLSHAALRASRLVVDTGIHHYGWSRERAVEFMWRNTATTQANVQNEIDRYIAWPGQAVSYLIGKREILRLRERARAALGDGFTTRGFHEAVLANGAVPLPVLDRQVSRWQAGAA